jgi:hypothetical protein
VEAPLPEVAGSLGVDAGVPMPEDESELGVVGLPAPSWAKAPGATNVRQASATSAATANVLKATAG